MPVLANTSCIGGMANEMSKTGHCEGRNDCRGCGDAAGIGRRVFILGRSSMLYLANRCIRHLYVQ